MSDHTTPGPMAPDEHVHADAPLAQSAAAPATPDARLSRRTVLLGGAATVVAVGAAGLVVANTRQRTTPSVQSDGQQPLTITCDLAAQRRPISPEIYGMAGGDIATVTDLGVTLARWGGNATTRYNWKLGNAFNAARDYYFRNGDYGATSDADRQPSGVADQAIAANHAHGVATLLTIPTIGWVARDDNNASASTGVPARGAPPVRAGAAAIPGYDPSANRRATSVPSRARKGSAFSDPPDRSDTTVAQDEWVYHLTRRFGSAAAGGVRYYAMDNEPDLWWVTHTDVRPAQMGYDQMRDTFLDYATAIKAVDSSAQITGPVAWGWPNYFYSALDYATDNYHTHADRAGHQDRPFIEWWLSEIRAHDERAGQRSLDALDLHFYPQGGEYSNDVSPDMAARRLRSTRALWDPTYTDESWINTPVQLIPRMRAWAAQQYPGVKLALTEWNWGAETTMNGALALAEALGVFGREGLDLACHWGGLTPGTPGYAAFKLFGNYDGSGASVTGSSCQARSTDDALRVFAVARNGALLLLALNTDAQRALTPDLRITNLALALGGALPRRARVWRVSAPTPTGEAHNVHITTVPDLIFADTADASTLHTSIALPPASITLLRVEAAA